MARRLQIQALAIIALTFALAGHSLPAAAADAADWKVDPSRSKLSFSGTKTGEEGQ